MNVSIIMPALNEAKNIHAAVTNTLQAFRDFEVRGEILVVDDGSKDRTSELVKEIIAKEGDRVRLLRHEAPEGIGKSFWDGVGQANYEIVAMFPGDNENDPWESLRYLSLLDHVDLVIPFVFNRHARPLHRNILSYLFRFIVNSTFLVNFNYTNGTILYRKTILSKLNFQSHGFFFQTDILIRLVKQGYLFAEVPYRVGMRRSGVSKAISWPSFFSVARGYLKLVRDMYFFNDTRKNDYHKFSQDSMSEKRHHELENKELPYIK